MSALSEGRAKPVNLSLAFRCLALDVISAYVLGGPGLQALSSTDFRHPFVVGTMQFVSSIWIVRYIPILSHFIAYPPQWLIPSAEEAKGEPDMKSLFISNRYIQDRLNEVLASPSALEQSNLKQETIFTHMLSHPVRPSYHELEHESRLLMQAGNETTALAVAMACFQVLNNPNIRTTLFEELTEVWPDVEFQVDLKVLEKLPYLVSNCFQVLMVDLIQVDDHRPR